MSHPDEHYACELCHDHGYIETGGDQTEPCPKCGWPQWAGPEPRRTA